jgi:kexin
MVAGAAALVLQANPLLTWRDVRLILATTARKNDPGSAAWQTNAAGLDVHPLHGFGVVDAQAATALARSWASVGGSALLLQCRTERTLDASLEDNTTITDAITVGADCPIQRIEFVEIGFSATHTYSGDLRIELERSAPPSPVALLAHARVCPATGASNPCGSYDQVDGGWVFGSVRHLEEPAQGQWTLRVTDAQAGDTGTWTGWSLTIWGR